MANLVTLAELRDRALDYADMAGTGFPDLDRVTDYINAGLSDLHDILVNSYEDYFRSATNLALVSGTETYALPTDFYKVLEVFYLSQNRRYAIEKYERKEIDGFQTGPLRSATVELVYVPQLTKLAADTDQVSIAVPVGWEDYVALHAGARLLMREESDPAPLLLERDRLAAKFVDLADPRDVANQGATEDVYGRWNKAGAYFREERYLRYRIMGNNIHFIEFEHLGA